MQEAAQPASAEEMETPFSPPLNCIPKLPMKQNKFADSSDLFKNFNSEKSSLCDFLSLNSKKGLCCIGLQRPKSSFASTDT